MARPTRTHSLKGRRRLPGLQTRIRPVFPSTSLALVSLTLATLVMLMRPLIERYARVDLPAALNTAPAPPLALQTVSISRTGALTLDGTPITPEALDGRLKVLAQRAPEAVIMLRGETGVSYGQVQEQLKAMRATGIQDIRLEVRQVMPTTASVTP